MFEQKITFDRFVRGILALLGLGLAIFLVNYLSNVLLPFFLAWFIAYMLYPIVKFLQYKLHLTSRLLSIIVTLLLIVSVITGIVMLVAPSIAEEFSKVKDIIIQFIQNGSHNRSIPTAVSRFIKDNISQKEVLSLLNEQSITSAVKDALPRLWNMIYETFNVVLSVIASLIVLLYLFFILMDYENISNGWIEFIPRKKRHFFATLASDVERGMNGYFRGQALVALGVGTLFSIGFLIIGFPMAIALGLFIGLLSMIPYMHALGLIPTVLLALLKAADTGQNFWVILLSALAVFAVVQIVQDTVLTPKIMGKIMGLNPAVILLALSVWGSLLGFIGLIVALPLTTLMISYYRRYVLKSDQETQPSDPPLSQETPSALATETKPAPTTEKEGE
jgi:predicted PurR-regulated permease PerM